MEIENGVMNVRRTLPDRTLQSQLLSIDAPLSLVDVIYTRINIALTSTERERDITVKLMPMEASK